MIKKLRRIGKVKKDSVEIKGKPGKPVVVYKKETVHQSVPVDQDFLKFFSGNLKSKSEWDKLLEAVEIPGIPDASWDRKAAWLYWQATR